MAKIVDRSEQFRRDGYIAPLDALSPEEAAKYMRAIDDYEAMTGEQAAKTIRGKGHLKLMALYELTRHPAVLDAVESAIGPNILCWNSSLFTKAPKDPSYVAWHQDVYEFDTHADKIVTAWIALLPSNVANGAMKVVPGSHHDRLMPHVKTEAGKPTMLRDGLEIGVAVDENKAVALELRQGQMSLHHMYIHHGSPPNMSDTRRCGFAVRYVAPEVAPEGGRYAATLVRGVDNVGRFGRDPVPTRDLDPVVVEYVERFGKPRLPAS